MEKGIKSCITLVDVIYQKLRTANKRFLELDKMNSGEDVLREYSSIEEEVKKLKNELNSLLSM